MDDDSIGQNDLIHVAGVANLAGGLKYVAPCWSGCAHVTVMTYGGRVGAFDGLIPPPGDPMYLWYDSGSMGVRGQWG